MIGIMVPSVFADHSESHPNGMIELEKNAFTYSKYTSTITKISGNVDSDSRENIELKMIKNNEIVSTNILKLSSNGDFSLPLILDLRFTPGNYVIIGTFRDNIFDQTSFKILDHSDANYNFKGDSLYDKTLVTDSTLGNHPTETTVQETKETTVQETKETTYVIKSSQSDKKITDASEPLSFFSNISQFFDSWFPGNTSKSNLKVTDTFSDSLTATNAVNELRVNKIHAADKAADKAAADKAAKWAADEIAASEASFAKSQSRLAADKAYAKAEAIIEQRAAAKIAAEAAKPLSYRELAAAASVAKAKIQEAKEENLRKAVVRDKSYAPTEFQLAVLDARANEESGKVSANLAIDKAEGQSWNKNDSVIVMDTNLSETNLPEVITTHPESTVETKRSTDTNLAMDKAVPFVPPTYDNRPHLTPPPQYNPAKEAARNGYGQNWQPSYNAPPIPNPFLGERYNSMPSYNAPYPSNPFFP